MRISFISKVTRVYKAMTVANTTSLCFTILVAFREFIRVDRAEHTTEFVPVTEPARLPGSYEEALRLQLGTIAWGVTKQSNAVTRNE